MSVRVHLCGRLAICGPHATVDESELPGRQGRLVFTRLALERHHPVSADVLAESIGRRSGRTDPSAALAPVISRLRTCLRRAAGCGPDVISALSGCYQLRLPPGSSLDVDDARAAIDRAEAHRRDGDVGNTWAGATVAVSIARRSFLPAETQDWVLDVQREFNGIARRGFECLAWVWTERADGPLAAAMAERAVGLDPLHEPAWYALIAAHATTGNRAAALRAHDRCRQTLQLELGVRPGPEIAALVRSLDGTAAD